MKLPLASFWANRRFVGEIEAIVLAEAGEVMVGQPGTGDIEDAALGDRGYVPQIMTAWEPRQDTRQI